LLSDQKCLVSFADKHFYYTYLIDLQAIALYNANTQEKGKLIVMWGRKAMGP